VRVVVGEDGAHDSGWIGERATGSRAQVTARCQRHVVDVVRVGPAVAVAVGAVARPGAGDELHRTHRAVELHVTVVRAAVGVADLGDRSGAVEPDSDDLRDDPTVQGDRRAAERSVVGLDPADTGEQ